MIRSASQPHAVTSRLNDARGVAAGWASNVLMNGSLSGCQPH
ncbi:hypothetical protein SynNOUM97013_02282 [Synechococcus sp. NOUM97013]|nr:hypothetical protein SynNOUM97013_02282 [Synechococcus sp. NOUM97013]